MSKKGQSEDLVMELLEAANRLETAAKGKGADLNALELPQIGGLLRQAAEQIGHANSTATGGKKPAVKKSATKATKKKKGPRGPETTEAWENGEVLSVKLYFDGGSRGNPGLAAGGVAFTHMTGEPLHDMAVNFDEEMTNNEAEYRTLIAGLRAAAEREVESVFAFGDSELVVKQIGGQYKIKKPHLAELAREVQQLRREFRQFSLVHIKRAENARADELANWAMDHVSGR